jgi:hypothetical protein
VLRGQAAPGSHRPPAQGGLHAKTDEAGQRFVRFGDAALKVLCPVIRNPIKNRANVTDKTLAWKQAINSPAGFYGDRVTGRWTRPNTRPPAKDQTLPWYQAM